MATWGAWVTNSSYGAIRLGYDFYQNPGNPSGNFPYSVDHVDTTLTMYLETQYSVNDSSYTFTVTGDWSAPGHPNIVTPSGGGIVNLGSQTQTRWLSPGSGGRQDFSASISGLYANNATASVSGTNWIAARAYGTGQVTLSATTFTMGDTITITANRPDASEYVRMRWSFGGASAYVVGSASTQVQTDTGSWVTDLPTLANQVPNATSGVGTVTCDFYDSSLNYIGSTTQDFTANVPATVKPTLTSATPADASTGPVGTTVTAGKYINGYSSVNFTLASSLYGLGESWASTTVTFDGVVVPWTGSPIPITKSTDIAVTIKRTDSRGRDSNVISFTLPVMDYSLPTAGTISYVRWSAATGGVYDPMGQYIKVFSSGSVRSMSNGGEKNTLAYTITVKTLAGAAAGTTITYGPTNAKTSWDDANPGSAPYAGGTGIIGDATHLLDAATSYNLAITVTDALGKTAVATALITSGQVALSLSATGVGVGKIWQQGAMDVAGDVYIAAAGAQPGNISFSGNLLQGGNQFIPPATSWEYAGLVLPSGGWLWQDGAAYSRTTYAALHAATSISFASAVRNSTTTVSGLTGMSATTHVGWFVSGSGIPVNTYIASVTNSTTVVLSNSATTTVTGAMVIGPYGFPSDGTYLTHFNVPDRRGRTGIGIGTATGANGATNHIIGQKSGEETHALTDVENGPHTHAIPNEDGQPPRRGAGGSAGRLPGVTFASYTDGTVTTYSSGSGTAHNNMQPYIGMNYIIKT